MQEDINQMVDWTFKRGVELNEDKVHLLHIGRNNPKRGYTLGEGGPTILSVEQEKDLGVTISSDLKSDKMVAKQCQRGHLKLTQHICILYSPGPVLAVLAHRMGMLSHPLKNGLIQHTSKIIFVYLEKLSVIPED